MAWRRHIFQMCELAPQFARKSVIFKSGIDDLLVPERQTQFVAIETARRRYPDRHRLFDSARRRILGHQQQGDGIAFKRRFHLRLSQDGDTRAAREPRKSRQRFFSSAVTVSARWASGMARVLKLWQKDFSARPH